MRAVVSSVLLCVFAVLAVSHLALAYVRIVKRRPGYSAVPLINGLIGAAGFWLSANSHVSFLWWLPFVLDWGCLPLLVEWLVWRLMQRQGAGHEQQREP